MSLVGESCLAQAVEISLEDTRLLCRPRRLLMGEGEVGLSSQRLVDGLARFRDLAAITQCGGEHRVRPIAALSRPRLMDCFSRPICRRLVLLQQVAGYGTKRHRSPQYWIAGAETDGLIELFGAFLESA